MNIAIVDDAKAVHAYLASLFEGSAIVLSHYHNGQEVLDALAGATPPVDLILLDWEMPILSGIDALPQITVLNSQVPVVMMTSKNAMSDIIRALENGAVEYVMKPFTKDILFEKIERVIGKRIS